MEEPDRSIDIRPIGAVVGGRTENIDDAWAGVSCRIVLDPAMLEESATRGLAAFSHIEVVFLFDRVRTEDICRGSRHPRGRADWPDVGILAQRAKDRPNRLGVTTCSLTSVDGLILSVCGLDAIDGTPILDIKPRMSGFGPRGSIREPNWAIELMSDYW